MIKRTYVGISDPMRVFQALKPFHDKLREMQGQCKPMGMDWSAIEVTKKALESTAFHFTRVPHFYSVQSDSAGLVRPRASDDQS